MARRLLSSPADDSKLAKFLTQDIKLTPKRDSYRLVRSDAMGDTTVTEIAATEITVGAVNAIITRELSILSGAITYRLHGIAKDASTASTFPIRARGQAPSDDGGNGGISVQLAGIVKEAMQQSLMHSESQFGQAFTMNERVMAHNATLMQENERLREIVFNLKVENAIAESGATDPVEEAKAGFIDQATSTLEKLPPIVMAVFGKVMSGEDEGGAVGDRISKIRVALSRVSEKSVKQLMEVLKRNKPFTQELMGALTPTELQAIANAFGGEGE